MRIVLFLLTNFLIIVAMSLAWGLIVMFFPELQTYNYLQLLVMSAVFGFVGSFISLAMSKTMAKRAVGAHVIEQPSNQVESWLVSTVRRQAEQAGIGMPEVAIFNSPDMNAFATGARRNSALVAVSTGLLQGMNREEAEAVLGHEISHVANGDMVTMSLLQGVANTFVFFLSSVVASMLAGNDNRGRFMYFMVRQALMIAFGWLAMFVVAWFSRRREFRADAGGAQLESAQSMANALRRLQTSAPPQLPAAMDAFGIHGTVSKLRSTHPPLEERIARLEARA